ncbi:hypothetical protein LEN26_002971 [Aphanomyces euteiches]|nr:hypothetical protein AeMF1_015661 [Aphanomyces euteiches]KAH9158443.1 hypothetical protein LEN26_002971 [Aphanomyces euteiches]KAH9181858.1 hypothetical protein AeNC1_016167 [Aphanomyces euteiches]
MRPQIDDVIEYMQQNHGVVNFALMGYIWGARYAAKYYSIEGVAVACGIVVCPSSRIDDGKRTAAPEKDMGRQVQVPQLMLCAYDEIEEFQLGGCVKTDLMSRPFVSKVWRSQKMPGHWFSLGDMTDPQVVREVQTAWNDAILPFLAQNLRDHS